MNNSTSGGSCLCGAVQLEAELTGPSVGACHCDICRRWGGGPLFALDGGESVRFESERRFEREGSRDYGGSEYGEVST